jgi:ABC-type antimicrobial peptide transport system permease subunit
VVLFLLQGLGNSYDGEEIIVTGILIVICWLGLWSQRPEKGKMLLDAHFPPIIPPMIWLIGALGMFAVGVILGYGLPLVTFNGISQLYLLELAFAGVGFLWLPLVAGVLAVRAIEQQSRKLDIS